MVVRQGKRNRRYLGTRTWGGGNTKNRRGAGDRGGVGRGGIKHKFTHKVVYEKERIGKKGFRPWRQTRLKEIDLGAVSRMADAKGEGTPTIELRGYKVLSDGVLARAATVKADAFSKKAIEKIKEAGGEAVKL